MKIKYWIQLICLVSTILVFCTSNCVAQKEIDTGFPADELPKLTTSETTLNESCFATVGNRNVQLNANGSFVLPNIPFSSRPFKIRVVCGGDGFVSLATSVFLTGVVNGTLDVGEIKFGEEEPVPGNWLGQDRM